MGAGPGVDQVNVNKGGGRGGHVKVTRVDEVEGPTVD